MREYSVAVVGATGAVGNEMLEILEERRFPIQDIRVFASSRSKGRILKFKEENICVEELHSDSFKGVELALFSAGSEVSRRFAPLAVKAGAVVVDNSSAFRMEKDVPLIVPEVNPHALNGHKGIIANPNCSTIQMVVVLWPLHKRARIKRVVVSTYQSVSGTGWRAMVELREQTEAFLENRDPKVKIYPHQIAFNLIPHIGRFLQDGYTEEEKKLVRETQKILEEEIMVTATAVRIPVFIGHSEAINIEFYDEITPEEAREILQNSPGLIVYDDPQDEIYPHPKIVEERDEVFVGRIRKDPSIKYGLDLWVVADNLRKGAALNAVEILEELVKG